MFRGKTTCFIRMFMRHFMNVHVGLYIRPREVTHIYVGIINFLFMYEGGNLAASKIRNLECPSYEICLIDYGCGKFNRKIHIMEQYP